MQQQQKQEEPQNFESLGSFEKSIKLLCKAQSQCTDPMCEKLHPRCFSGVCIEGLQSNKTKCSQGNCQLRHFNMKLLKTEYNIEPINGIYRFNICQEKDCSNCQFIHPQWVKGICVAYLNDECEEDPHDDLKHIQWIKLKEQIHQEMSVGTVNPENLCLKLKCDCDNHLPNMNDICLNFFKGLCPNLRCIKQHIFWEDFKTNTGQTQWKQLQPCTFTNKTIVIPEGEPSPIFVKGLELLRLRDEIKEQNRIDIIFIMDCTGSMASWLQNSSQQIYALIDKFKQSVPDVFTIRVGFVGYRDFCDNDQRIVFHDLTCQIDKVKQFISMQKATGGGDAAEDVYGGIKQAYELNITKNRESILVTFLFADAPTHGIQYHTGVSDDLRDKIDKGSLENLMKNYMNLKLKNFFFCVKIRDCTDKMFKIMQENFKDPNGENRLFITEPSKPEDFKDVVEFNLKETMKKTTTIQCNNMNCTVIKAKFLKPKGIPYSNIINKKEYWNSYIKKVNEILRRRQTEVKIYTEKMKLNVGDEGQTSFVYELYDVRNHKKMIAKIPKYVIEEYEKNKTLSDEIIQKANLYAQSRFDALIIAKQLANVYRQKVKGMKGAPPVFYVSPMIYDLDKPFMGLRRLYAETYINLPNCKWIKYSNNQFFTEKEFYYMTSFSHFTYEETEQELIVTDLQGKRNILTDPSIQTREQFNISLSQDETNQQMKGIGDFLFAQHKNCNQICQALKLRNNNLNQTIDNSQFQVKTSEPMYYICDICDEFKDISQEEYEKAKEVKCELCAEQEKLNDEVQCNCCKRIFQTPYEVKIKQGTVVNTCDDCKAQCKNPRQENKCIYCELYCPIQVKERQIGNQNIFLCADSMAFLKQLTCIRCNAMYNKSKLLSLDQYLNRQYVCDKCSK